MMPSDPPETLIRASVASLPQTPIKRNRGRPATPPEQRFHAKYIETANGCWMWQGCTIRDRYGQFTPRHGHKVYAHRWAYERWVGRVPEGFELDHLCGNPGCVNPAHLEPVTHKENMRRAVGDICKRGHRLTGDNVWTDNRGRRTCKACRRLRNDGMANTTPCGVDPFA